MKQHIFNRNHLKTGLLLLILFVLVFAMFQDFLHANFNNYRFYLSESLLFQSFWLLFIPFLFAQFLFLKAYRHQLQKRKIVMILLAITLPSILHMSLFAIMVWALSFLFFDHSYNILDTLSYTLAADLYKYIFIYGLAALTFSYRIIKYQTAPSQPLFRQKIVVNNSGKHTSIPTAEILFVDTCAPYIAIHTAQKTYLHTDTLKAIGEKLDPQQFIRVHRSAIINIKKVVSYKSRLNGDYDISLSNNEMVRLSRNYAAPFKELIHSA